MTELRRVKIAVLDDYADVARNAANWDDISGKPEISIFRDHLTDPNVLVERLRPLFCTAAFLIPMYLFF
jgi:hypothetical protein